MYPRPKNVIQNSPSVYSSKRSASVLLAAVFSRSNLAPQREQYLVSRDKADPQAWQYILRSPLISAPFSRKPDNDAEGLQSNKTFVISLFTLISSSLFKNNLIESNSYGMCHVNG